jgi:hypothetical protein
MLRAALMLHSTARSTEQYGAHTNFVSMSIGCFKGDQQVPKDTHCSKLKTTHQAQHRASSSQRRPPQRSHFWKVTPLPLSRRRSNCALVCCSSSNCRVHTYTAHASVSDLRGAPYNEVPRVELRLHVMGSQTRWPK